MVKIEDENQEKKEEQKDNEASQDESTHDPYFAPVVNLPEMEVRLLFDLNVVEWTNTDTQSLKVPTGEEEEQEIFKIRAKLFRFDTLAEPPEW